MHKERAGEVTPDSLLQNLGLSVLVTYSKFLLL
jgi:hypothetical protein